MIQNHLIGTVTLNVHASRQTDGVALQNEVSTWFWQSVLPELSRTLDDLVPPDLVLRLDRLALELPAVSQANWKEKLTQTVCRLVAEEIVRRRLFPRPTDTPIEEVSPATNSFEAWLDFIRTGRRRLSVAHPADWPTAALDRVATSPAAVAALRQLLRTERAALERLVRQHDDAFLVQLTEALTGHPAQEVLRWQVAFQALFTARWWQTLSGPPTVSPEEAALLVWMLIFSKISIQTDQWEPDQWLGSPVFLSKLLERVTHRAGSTTALAVAIARFFRQQYGQSAASKPGQTDIRTTPPNPRTQPSKKLAPASLVFTETALRQAIQGALQNLPERERLGSLFDRILEEQRPAVEAFLINPQPRPDLARGQHPAGVSETGLLPDAETNGLPEPLRIGEATTGGGPDNDVFYVMNAGVVLLHPFLPAYFNEVGLQPGRQADRRRAVQLIHYLATGEPKTPEFDLLLPKILAGWPINQPVDGTIRLSKTEKAEAQSLLQMVIAYWSVLGSTSAEGLREGFLRREGRLTKRDNGWLLQVETQTLDILLDQLPWGIGVIKHDWMTDFLYVEWQ